jgi:outer membrane immunogenic protein
MKKALLIITLTFIIGLISAQNPVAVGQKQLNAGVGLASWGVPVYVGLDYGVHKDITVGGEISYNSFRETYHSNHYNHTVFGILGNANYHFNHILEIPRDWDFYAGLNLGFYIWNSPDNYPGDHTSGLGLGAQIGGRYYFSPKAAVNLELGGGNAISGGKFGISVKL